MSLITSEGRAGIGGSYQRRCRPQKTAAVRELQGCPPVDSAEADRLLGMCVQGGGVQTTSKVPSGSEGLQGGRNPGCLPSWSLARVCEVSLMG